MHEHGAWILDPVTQVELWVPDDVGTERAIQRAQLERAGELFALRIFPERGVEWPVWRDVAKVIRED